MQKMSQLCFVFLHNMMEDAQPRHSLMALILCPPPPPLNGVTENPFCAIVPSPRTAYTINTINKQMGLIFEWLPFPPIVKAALCHPEPAWMLNRCGASGASKHNKQAQAQRAFYVCRLALKGGETGKKERENRRGRSCVKHA